MFKKFLRYSIFTSLFLLTSLVLLRKLTTQVKSVATHVVISEIQVGGITATDEFVELYNPTGLVVDLTGWKVMKKTASGTEDQLVVSISSGSIQPNGYFLVAHTDYDGTPTEDVTYSADATVSSNNTVLLYNEGDGLVDKVGMGGAGDFEGTDTTSSPANDRSVERKANSSSTKASMEAGGIDEFLGNGEDTDNNDLDFVLRTVSEPQNSSSPLEPSGTMPSPTPTEEPTESPTPTPEPTVTPTPETSSIVISEVQIAGATSTDEFVELYNPTGEAVNINDWKLTRKNSGGTENNLVSSLPDIVIQPYGYYLVSHLNYAGSPSADLNYSNSSYSLASNASVILYSDSDEVVDKVGMGTAVDFETSPTLVPGANESVERKANASSTASSMSTGGADENSGNSYDTDNNENDFVFRTLPNPQNSSSPTEPTGAGPTPTPEPTETPTPTGEPTETPTPGEPTPTPTVEPTPTPSPQPTPAPTGKVIGVFVFPGNITTCTLNYRFVHIGFFRAFFPYITCSRS